MLQKANIKLRDTFSYITLHGLGEIFPYSTRVHTSRVNHS